MGGGCHKTCCGNLSGAQLPLQELFCQLNGSLLCCVGFNCNTTATYLQHELQHSHATLFFTTQSAFLTLPRQGLFLRGSKPLNMEQGSLPCKLQRCVAVLQLCCSCVAVQVHATQQDTIHWHESFWERCPTMVATAVLGSHHSHLAKNMEYMSSTAPIPDP